MEPENTADYSKESYWSQRYTSEPTYDWFGSVYPFCVNKLASELESLLKQKRQKSSDSSAPVVLRVLHLGCGNSQLCRDLATRWVSIVEELNSATEGQQEQQPQFVLRQIAVDYSSVVVENMRETHLDFAVGASSSSPSDSIALRAINEIEWHVGDVRDLSPLFPNLTTASSSAAADETVVVEEDADGFDLIIDKGTMDAIQADKESDYLDEDLDAMLKEVSRLLKRPDGVFIQITWEIPYYRLHITKQEHYVWREISNALLGESDMYRYFRYTQSS